jgi:hypothetical protein
MIVMPKRSDKKLNIYVPILCSYVKSLSSTSTGMELVKLKSFSSGSNSGFAAKTFNVGRRKQQNLDRDIERLLASYY